MSDLSESQVIDGIPEIDDDHPFTLTKFDQALIACMSGGAWMMSFSRMQKPLLLSEMGD